VPRQIEQLNRFPSDPDVVHIDFTPQSNDQCIGRGDALQILGSSENDAAMDFPTICSSLTPSETPHVWSSLAPLNCHTSILHGLAPLSCPD
jgi:hypothetical protein